MDTIEDIKAYGSNNSNLVGVRAVPGSVGVSSDDPRIGDLKYVLDQIRIAHGHVAAIMHVLPPGKSVMVEDIGRLHQAYETLSNLEAFLPRVNAWCVLRGVPMGTKGGEPTYSWSVWDGHTTEEQARAFCKAWDAKDSKLSRQMGWSLDKWIVERREVPITSILAPGLDAEKYVAESGAFER